MYIATSKCSFKCDKECGRAVCQNSKLAHEPTLDITIQDLISRYMSNPITKAIVISGMEPFDTPELIYELVYTLREDGVMDDIVIYTGYNKEEILDKIEWLSNYENIIVKFGRYIPNQTPHYEEILGVMLASDNQYAERLDK